MPPKRAKRHAPAEPPAQLRRSKRIKNQNSDDHRVLSAGELYREINVRGLAAPTRRVAPRSRRGQASASRGNARATTSKGKGKAVPLAGPTTGPASGPAARPAAGKGREQYKGKGKAKVDADVESKGKGKARVESAESVTAAATPTVNEESPLFVQNGPSSTPKNPFVVGFGRTPVRGGGPTFLQGTSSHLGNHNPGPAGMARVESAESVAAAATPTVNEESPLFVQNGPSSTPHNPFFVGFGRTPDRKGGPSFLQGTSSQLGNHNSGPAGKELLPGQGMNRGWPAGKESLPGQGMYGKGSWPAGQNFNMQNGQPFAGNPLQPGNNPLQSGNNPLQSGNNPLQSGNNPLQNGNNPLQSGNNPLQPGNNPLQPGNNPLQSRNSKMQNGQPFLGNSAQNGKPPFHGSNVPQSNGLNNTGATGSGMFGPTSAPGYSGQTGQMARNAQLNALRDAQLNALRATSSQTKSQLRSNFQSNAQLNAQLNAVSDAKLNVLRAARSSFCDNRPTNSNHRPNAPDAVYFYDNSYFYPAGSGSKPSDRPTSVAPATSDIARQEASVPTSLVAQQITPSLGASESPPPRPKQAPEVFSAPNSSPASESAPVTESEAVPHGPKVEPETVETTAPVAEFEDGGAETIHASASDTAPTPVPVNVESENVEPDDIETENDGPENVVSENVDSKDVDPENVDSESVESENADPEKTEQPETGKLTGVIETTVAFYANDAGDFQGGEIKETFVARTRDSVEEGEQIHEAHMPDAFSVSDGGSSCGDVESEEKQIENSEPVELKEKQEHEADVPDSFSVSGGGFSCGDVETEEKLSEISELFESEEKQTETSEPVESEEEQTETLVPVKSEEQQTQVPKTTVEDESDEQADS